MSLYDEFPKDWQHAIESFDVKREHFDAIEANLTEPYYPPRADIFKAFKLCPFGITKVVIIGQDPYPNKRATGLAFAVRQPDGISNSLSKVYNLLQSSGHSVPSNSELEGWARQGVLLLNTILTVSPGRVDEQALSHERLGWQKITNAVIEAQKSRDDQPVLFLAWGKPARKAVGDVTRPSEVWTCAHPAARFNAYDAFVECDHFRRMNMWLLGAGFDEIDWGRG